jgi:HSP20 family protein
LKDSCLELGGARNEPNPYGGATLKNESFLVSSWGDGERRGIMKSMLTRRPSFGASTLDDRWFDSFFDDFIEGFRIPNTLVNQPSTDISYTENGKTMHVEMEVPGYDRDNIQMSLNNGVLEIRGERTQKEEHKGKNRSYVVRESNSSFARRIVLPDGADSEKITAEMESGILSVRIPVEQPETKRIEIAAPKKGQKAKLASIAEAESGTE